MEDTHVTKLPYTVKLLSKMIASIYSPFNSEENSHCLYPHQIKIMSRFIETQFNLGITDHQGSILILQWLSQSLITIVTFNWNLLSYLTQPWCFLWDTETESRCLSRILSQTIWPNRMPYRLWNFEVGGEEIHYTMRCTKDWSTFSPLDALFGHRWEERLGLLLLKRLESSKS